MKKDRENQRQSTSNVTVRYFWVNKAAHAPVRLSYEFGLWVFVRYARWRACEDSLSCWTWLALANQKEDEN